MAKAERTESSTIPESLDGNVPSQGEPIVPPTPAVSLSAAASPVLQIGAGTELQPPMEVPSPVASPPLTKAHSAGDMSTPLASKSWSWSSLEIPVPPRQPEEVVSKKGEWPFLLLALQGTLGDSGLFERLRKGSSGTRAGGPCSLLYRDKLAWGRQMVSSGSRRVRPTGNRQNRVRTGQLHRVVWLGSGYMP